MRGLSRTSSEYRRSATNTVYIGVPIKSQQAIQWGEFCVRAALPTAYVRTSTLRVRESRLFLVLHQNIAVQRVFVVISLTGECCAPFLRVSPATVPPEMAPTVAGGHLRHSGTSASDAPPLRRRNVMPLAMRPLREHTAHCRRTYVLPSALTRSPPVAAPTPNKRPSGIG